MKPIYRDILTTPDASFAINRFKMPFFDIPWHLHPQYEIIYIVNSTGTRYVGDSIEPFEKDDLVLMGNELPHCWLNAPINECKGKNFDVDYIVVQFNPDFLGNDFFQKPEFNQLNQLLKASKRGIHFEGKVVKKIEKKLFSMLKKKGLERLILFFQLLNKLVDANNQRFLSSEGFIKSIDYEKHPAIKKIKTYVYENFKTKIKLEEVAELAGMTETSFCRFFKSQQKQTFLSYLKEFRIGYASRQLRETDLSINEICYESGYDNLANFYRDFKNRKKVTPKMYRHK